MPNQLSVHNLLPQKVVLPALLVVAAILRLKDLGDGMWFDEISTLVQYVRPPLSHILTTFDSKNQHLLYSVLAHGSVRMFGESAWALRLPAAILGVASIGALAWFGGLITSRREALAASALLTFSYHHVWFSQNARGYTGLLLAALVASGILLKITARITWSWRLAIGYGLTMGLAVYMHITAGLIVIGHIIWWGSRALLFRRGEPRSGATWLPLAGFALAVLLSLVFYAPVLPKLLPTLLMPDMGGVTGAWKNPVWFAAETVRSLGRGLPGGWLTLGIASLVTILGFASYARRNQAIVWLMLLPGIVTGIAMLASGQNLWPRFFFFAAGFGALIVVRGLFIAAEHIWPARAATLGTVVAVLLVIASATTVPLAWRPKQDYLGARAFVERSRGQGDAIVTTDMTDLPFRQYQRLDWPVVTDSQALAAIETAHGRTWVLVTFPVRLASVQPGLWNYIRRHYAKAAIFDGTIVGGEILVMTR